MKNFSRSAHGFTLVELMVTVAILAILAAIAYPSYIDYIHKSRLEQARTVILDNVKMMERYYGLARSFNCQAVYASKMNATCRSATMNKIVTNQVLNVTEPDPKLSSIGTYYNFDIQVNGDGNSYTISATPKTNQYSSKTLDSKKLYLTYNSLTNNYVKCTKSGIQQLQSPKQSNPNSCEVL